MFPLNHIAPKLIGKITVRKNRVTGNKREDLKHKMCQASELQECWIFVSSPIILLLKPLVRQHCICKDHLLYCELLKSKPHVNLAAPPWWPLFSSVHQFLLSLGSGDTEILKPMQGEVSSLGALMAAEMDGVMSLQWTSLVFFFFFFNESLLQTWSYFFLTTRCSVKWIEETKFPFYRWENRLAQS